MKSKGLFKKIGCVVVGSIISLNSMATEDQGVSDKEVMKSRVESDATLGRQYFEGSKKFKNGGPACITCHNVNNDKLIPGGLLAKDLTDVYDRMGEGITAWLGAPPFPAMVSSYQNHALSESERSNITAFLKHANEVKASQKNRSGTMYFIYGGLSGLTVILIIISLLWMKRKKQMVKKDIFARQRKTWDAKH